MTGVKLRCMTARVSEPALQHSLHAHLPRNLRPVRTVRIQGQTLGTFDRSKRIDVWPTESHPSHVSGMDGW
jgi:hypothetical protein